MNKINLSLSELYSNYKDWVCRNPQTASEVETTVKWLSFFIAGKVNKSVVLNELVYAASNLLVLFNDMIINASKQTVNSCSHKIKVWLTVLEYSEVFIEISTKKLWGEKGKWAVIVCIQILKCIARLTLLLHYKEKIVCYPPIMPSKRCQEKEEGESKCAEGIPKISNIAFSLKRSGRVIRKVDSAPPLTSRLWKPPSVSSYNHNNNNLEEEPNKALLKQHLIGEVLYIVKPMVHLAFMMKYGQRTWKPWTVSAAMDFISLYLLSKSKNNKSVAKFSPSQQLELSRRRLVLLLYLMRSPFYERHSKDRINAFLNSLSRNLPLANFFCVPIQQLLPHWQEMYFYLWSL